MRYVFFTISIALLLGPLTALTVKNDKKALSKRFYSSTSQFYLLTNAGTKSGIYNSKDKLFKSISISSHNLSRVSITSSLRYLAALYNQNDLRFDPNYNFITVYELATKNIKKISRKTLKIDTPISTEQLSFSGNQLHIKDTSFKSHAIPIAKLFTKPFARGKSSK
jgi:hypothetical protein